LNKNHGPFNTEAYRSKFKNEFFKVLGRTLRVDHSWGPKKQKKKDEEEESDDDRPKMNVAPELMQGKKVLSLYCCELY
jgi:hypothetical protein